MARRATWSGFAWLVAGAAALVGAGCSGGGEAAEATKLTDIAGRAADGPTPGAPPGLTMVSWTTRVDETRLAAALLRFEGSGIIPPEAVERWRRAGLRVLAFPAEDLAAVRGELAPEGGVQKQFLGEPSAWTAVLQGPAIDSAKVSDGEAAVTLTGGTLRLLTRGWVRARPMLASDGGAGPGRGAAEMLVELLPQHRDAPDALARVGLGDYTSAVTGDATREGLSFRALNLSAAVPRGVGLLIVPADPASDWRSMVASPQASPSAAAASAEASDDGVWGVGPRIDSSPGPRELPTLTGAMLAGAGASSGPGPSAPGAAAAVGPRPASGTPLGFLLLTRDAAEASLGRAPRGVVALVPTVPERYSLTR